jgi:hypothetical protein
VNTTISEADDKPEHIAEILRHWLKKRQQVIDTLTILPDDSPRRCHPSPLAPAGRRSGRGLIQTRMTAQRGL